MKLTPGQIVVALYCAIFLVAPLIWNISFGSASWSHYSFLNPGSFAIFLALTLLLIVASPIMSMKVGWISYTGIRNWNLEASINRLFFRSGTWWVRFQLVKLKRI